MPDHPFFLALIENWSPLVLVGLAGDESLIDENQPAQAHSVRVPLSQRFPPVVWLLPCPKFLRQTFHEWATHSIRSSAWAKEYYERQRAKGKPHHVVVRALAFKWIRILFRCWKDRKPYNDALFRLDPAAHNRGLYFTPDTGLCCGSRQRVVRRLDKIIVDGTGQMRQLRNTVYLEGAHCGCSHVAFGGCPRGEFSYWREIWLQRR
jgi:hypothetical protein